MYLFSTTKKRLRVTFFFLRLSPPSYVGVWFVRRPPPPPVVSFKLNCLRQICSIPAAAPSPCWHLHCAVPGVGVAPFSIHRRGRPRANVVRVWPASSGHDRGRSPTSVSSSTSQRHLRSPSPATVASVIVARACRWSHRTHWWVNLCAGGNDLGALLLLT